MISYVIGNVVEKQPSHIVLEHNGIGFEILIPVSTFDRLQNDTENVKILTYLHVREDALTLFGFYTTEERELFLDLISVSGIGPKLALGILAGDQVAQIYKHIAEANEPNLTRIKGLGKKTAQRLILDLKDKAGRKVSGASPGHTATLSVFTEQVEQAVLAMVSLGYSRAEAETAITRAVGKIGAEKSVEELVRTALSGS